MLRDQPRRLGHVSAVAGCVLSLLTLVAALAIVAVPTLVPVGLLGAAVLSIAVLSLPVWATGIAYSLSTEPPDVPPRLGRTMQMAVLGSLGLFLLGILGTASDVPPGRTVGNALYLVGTVLLLAVSVALLSAE